MADIIKPDRIIEIDNDAVIKKVVKKFDQLSAFRKIGASSFFEWMTPPKNVDNDTIVLYASLGAAEYDLVRYSLSTRFPKPESGPYFYIYGSRKYAETLTQLYSGKKGTAFLMKCVMKKSYISRFEDYGVVGGGKGYFVPVASMEEFNSNIIGNIETVKMFLGQGVL